MLNKLLIIWHYQQKLFLMTFKKRLYCYMIVYVIFLRGLSIKTQERGGERKNIQRKKKKKMKMKMKMEKQKVF